MATVDQITQLAFSPNQAKHLGINGIDLLLGGWIPATYVNPASPFDVVPLTLTYASATTATVPYDITDQIEMGTRCKFTQTTVKYAVVKSASYGAGVTTITFFENDDYSVANAAITAPYFSQEERPLGFPPYFNFTPDLGAQAGSFSATDVDYARFYMSGKNFDIWVSFDWTLITATADWVSITTPGDALCDGNTYCIVRGQNGAFNSFVDALDQNANNDIYFYRGDATDWALGTGFVWGYVTGTFQ